MRYLAWGLSQSKTQEFLTLQSRHCAPAAGGCLGGVWQVTDGISASGGMLCSLLCCLLGAAVLGRYWLCW